MKMILLFIVLYAIASAAIFGYRYVSKNDVKVAGKLTFAAIVAAVLSVFIYLGEVG